MKKITALKKPTKTSTTEKKTRYHERLCELLDTYSGILIVGADNVGSKQLQTIRQAIRGDSVILMGKNTMMRRSIRLHAEHTGNSGLLNLIPLLVGNVGLLFTHADLKEVRDEISRYKVGSYARHGVIAPVDVIVPPGNTGLDPSHTPFFQVLNIPTRINKGTVEIITPLELVKKGGKVGSSEAHLLSKLKIKPFSCGLIVKSVYDNGLVFQPEVLNLTEDDIVSKFAAGLSNVISLSMALSYPTLAAVPQMFINVYKNVLSVAVATEYSFPQAEPVKECFKDPSDGGYAAAPAAASGAATTAAASGAAAAAAAASAAEENKEEVGEESDDDYVLVFID